ncbi:MAG TPA: isochorismatase family cysteine hydrolase [Candidatus Acidoferrales bacterium]|nr:isochorismatase family cysteine hydrolase [Candidatus Acidoferrales bacterium]
MPSPLALDPARTAVLSMDLQSFIVAQYAKEPEAFLARVSSVLERARASGIAVIHVQVGFRPGLPEVSPRNALFAAIRANPKHQQAFLGPAGAIHPAVAPREGDIIVTKHRVSAFAGTDLEMVLRAREIDTLVLFGISTSGVVLSTLLHASDADYRLIVLRDCCADLDAELHSCLLDKFFPHRATVLSSSDFLANLKSASV